MSIFMRAYDYEMWDVVLDDPYVPMKTKVGSEALESKIRSEWIELEIKKVQVNFKAINTLHCVLNSTEFNRISTCKTAKKFGTSSKSFMKEHPKLRSQRLHFSPTNTKCSKCKKIRASHLSLTNTQLS